MNYLIQIYADRIEEDYDTKRLKQLKIVLYCFQVQLKKLM